jgi:phage shock protein A
MHHEMDNTEVLISGIAYKIKALIAQKNRLQEQKDELEQKFGVLKQQSEAQANKIHDLEARLEAVRIAKSLASAEDATAIHRRIDELVRDINKSIGLLNKSDK